MYSFAIDQDPPMGPPSLLRLAEAAQDRFALLPTWTPGTGEEGTDRTLWAMRSPGFL